MAKSPITLRIRLRGNTMFRLRMHLQRCEIRRAAKRMARFAAALQKIKEAADA